MLVTDADVSMEFRGNFAMQRYESANASAVRPLKPFVETYQGAVTGPGGGSSLSATQSYGIPYAIGAVYLFFIFSHATEFIDSGGRFHLVVLTAAASVLAVLASGQLPAVFSSKPGVCLTFFTMFLIVGIPFSAWKGNSVANFFGMWWKSYLTFFLVGGLVFTVNQARRSLFFLGIGTAGLCYEAFKSMANIANTGDGRLSAEYGTLGNANDLAEALLIGLPFVVYVIVDKKRAMLVRLAFVPVIVVILYLVFKTGSRSSVLAIAVMALMVFIKTNAQNKAKILVLSAVAAVVFPFVAGQALMVRYKTMFSTEKTAGMADDAASAIESTQARRQLMINAVELTARYPIFGVGLGNFRDQSANLEISKGRAPLWFTCHDIYLLVSSETGVFGIVLYMATMLFTLKTLIAIERAAKRSPELNDLGSMAFCILMAFVVYATCGIFSTIAYGMQLPMLAGLTVALDKITKPILASAEERRMESFRQSIPVRPGKFTQMPNPAFSNR